ncbi:MAG: LPS assembly protein LptD [Planctomycetia bacterium]|nr:LPS assembly protein LptD [Planctomycetia bacterium]
MSFFVFIACFFAFSASAGQADELPYLGDYENSEPVPVFSIPENLPEELPGARMGEFSEMSAKFLSVSKDEDFLSVPVHETSLAESTPEDSRESLMQETESDLGYWRAKEYDTVTHAEYKVPTLTDDGGITFPRTAALEDMTVTACRAVTFSQGSYNIHVLEGNCKLRQGKDLFCAQKMVIWEDQSLSYENAADFGEVPIRGEGVLSEEMRKIGNSVTEGSHTLPVYRVLVYLDGDARISFVARGTTSRVNAPVWSGRLFTLKKILLNAETHEKLHDKTALHGIKFSDAFTLYKKAEKHVFREVKVILTQWSENTELLPEAFSLPEENTSEEPLPEVLLPLEDSSPREHSLDVSTEDVRRERENSLQGVITDRQEETERGVNPLPGERNLLLESESFPEQDSRSGEKKERDYGSPTSEPRGVLIPPTSEEMERFPGTFSSGHVTPGMLSSSFLSRRDVSGLDPNVPSPGTQSISIYPRSDVPLQFKWFRDPKTQQWIGIIDSGVNVIIEGADSFLKENVNGTEKIFRRMDGAEVGTIDISTDRLVVWAPASSQTPMLHGNTFAKESEPPEIYMEGNVIFRQGDRKIHADRMYFDVLTKRGIIREAEVFTSLPKMEGLLRLRAEEIRVPEEGIFVARNTYVTTSRMGDPLYRFQMGQIMLRSQQHPKVDPHTGMVILDPVTGEAVMEGPNELIGQDAVVRAGDIPIFYWRQFTIPLERPTTIINRLSLRHDSIFGFQPIIGVDAYRLFGIQRPWTGTEWDLYASYYTKRGPGFGTKFSWNRMDRDLKLGWFSGPGQGYVDFWGIYDTGYDNLGFGRYHLRPEVKWRYQIIGKHHSIFANDIQLKVQLGVLSDRNFQEEYFQNSWYTEPDRATQIEFRQERENRVWSVWADLRVNDFHTQTQRTPQAEFYWIGQPLFRDVLSWSSYSQVGYVHLFPDTYPTDPADRALFHLLEWETNQAGDPESRKGYRASTRHEISYPFQAGAVKIVPYALGELAAWGEDLNGESAERAYGQVGIRASLPMWRHFDFHSELLNVHGVRHKVEFRVEASWSKASMSAYDLPLYDLIDDRAILDFRHHMQSAIFGGMRIPPKYDSRSYAIRSNLGGWVTSPSTELADDLILVRFGMHHRWQTKRGMPGRERIIDWMTFDLNFNIYPDKDRDNFGSLIGLLDYDFRYHVGDRLTLFTSGSFDFFSDGLRIIDVGAIIDRPGSGSFFTSLHYLTGPVDNVVMRIGYNYWMSEKWASTFLTTFDISGKGNIGESLSVTRIGESALWTLGVSYDGPSDNFGVFFTLEPRFGKLGNISRQLGIPAPGTRGVD